MTFPPELVETRGCLCLASRRAARSITRIFDRALRPYGLRSTQFSILSMLMQAGPMPIGALADDLSVERSTLSRNIALMEERGFVRTAPGEDARARLVEAAPKGRSAVIAALPAWRKTQASLSESLSATGADALRRHGEDERDDGRPPPKPTSG